MKETLKKVIGLLGYEVRKKKINFFKKNKIDLIIDIGAHEGNFAVEILNEGFKGKILSFEPQSQVYLKLKNKSKKYKNWFIHERCGIGKNNQTSILNVMSETTCSSYLKPNKNLFSIDPYSKIINKEKTKMFSLNFLFSKKYKLKKKTFLKIDTQGYDKMVLDGASKILNKIMFIQLEVSIEPLYNNELNYQSLINYMKKRGFKIWNIGGVIENIKGKSMSFDLTFRNTRI